MNNRASSIVFWDVYNAEMDGGMGGIERMIITLTEEYSKSREVKLIAKDTGIIYRILIKNRVDFIHINPSSVIEKAISAEDLLITFNTYRDFVRLAKPNPKVLLWRVYPSLCIKKTLYKTLVRLIFSRLERKNSLAFMDLSCLDTATSELGRNYKKTLIPLPIKPHSAEYTYKYKGKRINISYIGRGTEIWKVKPVKKLVTDLNRLSGGKFCIHIFTNTRSLFEKELNQLLSDRIEVKYYINYYDDKLSDALIAIADLHYSMGTSALEGGILGIPTLIADASFKDFPENYRYRWLIDDPVNYAGVFIEERASFKGYPIEEIINLLYDLNKTLNVSELTQNFVKANFLPAAVCNKIDELKPWARVKEILTLMPRYWLKYRWIKEMNDR